MNMSQLNHFNQAKLKQIKQLEVDLMSDLYNRIANACQKKCLPPRYNDPELGRGEAVCIDRCVAKYLDIYQRIGEKLVVVATRNDDLTKNSTFV